MRNSLGHGGGELIITEPKTDRSRRTVPLSAPLVAMLRVHRSNQDAERHAARDQWQENDLVFATESGTPVDPRNVLRTVQIAAQKAGLADIGLHTRRHSAAVAWLESGVHIKAVADLLGHSSIAVTGDVYGHTRDTTAHEDDGQRGNASVLTMGNGPRQPPCRMASAHSLVVASHSICILPLVREAKPLVTR